MRRSHGRSLVAGLAGLALAISAQSSATAAADGAADILSEPSAAPVASTATVTLVTGDRVRLVTALDGSQNAYLLPDPTDPSPGAMVLRTNDGLAVYPTEALPYLRSGALDRSLFDVTALVSHGLDDASTDRLQLMATSPSSPVTTGEAADGGTSPVPAAPPASEATTKAPWLGLVGLRVDKQDAREFWAGLEASSVDADGEAGFRRGVGRLWLDRRVQASLDQTVGQIGAPAAYAAGLDGAGVTVAVLDTGIDDEHPDVAGQVTAQADFTGEGTTDDLFGHGTHVASIVAGTGELSDGRYRGVAPGATLLDGRVLDAGGFGDESWIIAGMEWAAQQGADIANLSLGGWPTDGTDPMSAAADALTAEYGTLFVIAAGNDGNGVPSSNPGTATAALTVGSVDRLDALSWFSNGAPRLGDAAIKPEISAPGEDVVAAQADGTELGPVVEPGYIAISGTSMATPHVAGAAALMAQEHPDWTAAQLKAGLVSTSAPVDAAVYRAGVGRVDIATALATDDLQVDAGTLGFGFFAWPHVADEPVTKDVTYTNTGAADVTLDLAAALSEADTAERLADGAVKISPVVLTVPAGGSAPVEVTVDPGAADPGQWSGTLVATAEDGRTLRTGLGFESEPERYDITVTVLGEDGEPTSADVFLLNLDTGDVLDSWSVVDPSAPYRAAPGRWSVIAMAFGGDATTSTITTGFEPEVTVSGDTEIVIDLATAEPVVVKPADSGVVQSSGTFGVLRMAEAGGFGISTSTSGPAEFRVTPTDPVTAGTVGFEVDTSWRVPALTATLVRGGRELNPQLVTDDDRLDGTRTVRVRPLAAVQPGDVALVVAPVEESLDGVVAAAAAAGASAVITYSTSPWSGLWLEEPADIPVIALPTDEGERVAKLAAGRSGTRIHLTGEFSPSRTYDLIREWQGESPAGATVVVKRRNLAAISESYRTMAGEGQAYQVQLPWTSLGGWFVSQPVPLGGTRTTYLSPGYAWDTLVDYGAYEDPEWGFTIPTVSWRDSTEATDRGSRTARTWLEQVSRPAVPAEGLWATRIGEDLFAGVPLWTDGAGHPGDSWVLDRVSWRLTANGTEVATGSEPWVQATVDPRRATYRLTMATALTSDPTWRLSTSTRTTWTFSSRHTDPDAEPKPLALLSVDADLPLDQDNTAPARRWMTFPVDVRAPEGIAASRVSRLVVETSTDGGATWHKAVVRRTDADSFSVTLRNGAPGEVALRMTAARADGTAVRQEVQAAYLVR